ncbi:MAG TPA: hypothetical protein VF444_12925, partial [Pseudonocardiaceae bacterium]
RSALDSALSSPAELGIAVDDNGAVLGSVSADDVLAELAAARRATGGQTATDTDRPADRTAGATGRISR